MSIRANSSFILADSDHLFFSQAGYLPIHQPLLPETDFVLLRDYFLNQYIPSIPENLRHYNPANHLAYTPKRAWAAWPGLVRIIEQVLGPNILLWSVGVCYKAPNSQVRVPWHCDSHFWVAERELEPVEVLTVFLPLTDCLAQHGCLRVIPGSTSPNLYHHQTTDLSTNFFYREIDDPQIDLSQSVDVELRANHGCLLSTHIVHSSEQNQSAQQRLALTIRYIRGSTRVRYMPEAIRPVYLVQGNDLASNYCLEFGPDELLEKSR